MSASPPRKGPAPVSRHRPRIGVLALQGDFAAHLRALEAAGTPGAEIRDVAAIESLDGLVVPGGESTTLLRLLGDEGSREIRRFAERGGAILGTCAGLILLAREVRRPSQPSLGLIDVAVERNAYGRQVDSFVARGEWVGNGGGPPLEMVFIRAPKIVRCAPGVETLATHDGDPVLVRQGRILAATFHPELGGDRRVHAEFARLASAGG